MCLRNDIGNDFALSKFLLKFYGFDNLFVI